MGNEVLPGNDNHDAITLTTLVIFISLVGSRDDVAVFSTKLVHDVNSIITVARPITAATDDILGVNLGRQVVVGTAAKLSGVAAGRVHDGAVDVLLTISLQVGMATLEERYVNELMGSDVLVKVAKCLLNDGVPVSVGIFDVMEVVFFTGGVVSEPHDLVLEAHDIFGGVCEGDDLATVFGEALSFLGL
jgi:hypothetical protein